MKKFFKITPEGTKDLLLEECKTNRVVNNILLEEFRSKGYHEVMTPGIEYYDLFSFQHIGIPQESMYKLTDNKGRLMVIRPDTTLPIARMVATRLQKELTPIKLSYSQRVYRCHPSLTGKSSEVTQAGIELIGASGKRADLEVITTAIEALGRCVPDFRIEIGHAGFFKAIAEQLPVDDSVREDIRLYIEAKNYTALNTLLDSLEQTKAVETMRKLPRLFGGEEVFDIAMELFDIPYAIEKLEYLKDIYHSLSTLNLGNRLIVDLGLVQRNDYYTDIVFSGYVEGSGEAVLIGGRYDRLYECFGSDMASSGFGINVDAITKVIMDRGNTKKIKSVDILVHADDGYEMKALEYVSSFKGTDITCENSVFSKRDDAIRYAKNKGVSKIIFINENTEELSL